MLGVIKKVCSLCVRIWLYLFQALRHKSAQARVESARVELPRGSEEGSWEESGWGSDGWEEFSVKVIPSSEEPSEPTILNSEEQDLFKDMVPIFRKTKKINVRQTGPREEQVNMDKFAVQNSFQNDEGSLGELGVWNEEGSADAWEEELIPAEGELVQSSMASVKEKRRLEREERRAAQELLRTQQKTVGRHLQLGTKVS